MIFNLNYLQFSDAAKFADLARNIVLNGGPKSSFEFFGGPPVMPQLYPKIISFMFYLFGVGDKTVIFSSALFFALSLAIIYFLVNKISGSKFLGLISVLVVGFNKDLINYALSGASESLLIFEIFFAVYLVSLNKKIADLSSIIVLVAMYFTRQQSIIYILGIILYYIFSKFKYKKAIIYSTISFIAISLIYLYFNNATFAITQNLSQNAVSDSLRGLSSSPSIVDILKKVFYNLYNFYKALPEIFNPYLFTLFVIGLFSSFAKASEDKTWGAFKISSLFMVLATFFVTAITIPFYRYIHPIIPFVYIIGVITLWEIINNQLPIIKKIANSKFQIINEYRAEIITIFLVLFFAVGQTLGIIFLDSRFEKKTKNVGKPPIYVLMSWKLKEITNENQVVLTNLDTWGSWHGDRKTIWFPIEPSMVVPVEEKIDAIYLTSYKMDDENYYMGEIWRDMFLNPEDQKILPDYKYVGDYQFTASDNYDKENGRAVLFVRKDEIK